MESVQSRAVILNAGRLDFDHALDMSKLAAVATISRHEATEPEEVMERAAGQEVLITKEMPLDRDTVAQLPESVRLIVEAGTGFNNIAVQAARDRGITVCNIPAYSSDAVAQLVVTFILSFSCSLLQQQRMLLGEDRRNFTQCLQVPHFELNGKVLGLVGGRGGIGSKVMKIALTLGMRVLVSSRSAEAIEGAEVVPLAELVTRSDFVSIHCPLNDTTRGSFDKEMLQRMKPTAFLINTARGAIVNEEDLIEVLRSNLIAGAGLDVQVVEPPPEDSPLYSLPNVIMTPHIGWKRLETRQRLMDLLAENVAAFLRGEPINVVS